MKRELLISVFSIVAISGCAGTPSLVSAPTQNPDTGNSSDPKSRTIQINSDSHTSVPPIKIVLVVDNSNSMLDKQQNLAAGISTLLQSFESSPLDLKLYVYTTTADAQSDSSKHSSALQTTTNVIQDNLGHDIAAPTGTTAYTSKTVWTLNAPYGSFAVNAIDSSANVQAVETNLTNSIRQIGINGSDLESPFCTIGRVLAEDRNSPRAIFSDGSRGAFLFITDANDSSAQLPCLSEQRQQVQPATTNNPSYVVASGRSDASAYVYSMSFVSQSSSQIFQSGYRANSVCLADNIYRPCVVNRGEIIWPGSVNYSSLPLSPSWTGCTNSLLTYYQNQEAQYAAVQNADFQQALVKYGITPSVVTGSCNYISYPYTPSGTCQYVDYNFTQASPDVCSASPITINGTTYTNFENYCRAMYPGYGQYVAQACNETPYKFAAEANYGPAVNIPLMNVLDPNASDLQTAIVSKAQNLFGQNGFFFSGIFLDDQTSSCAASMEHFGDNLLDFINGLGNRGFHSSVCGTDYSPALAKVNNFIQKIVQNSYSVSLNPGELISSVSIQRQSTSVPLQAGVDYSTSGGTIDFTPGALQVGDIILVKATAE